MNGHVRMRSRPPLRLRRAWSEAGPCKISTGRPIRRPFVLSGRTTWGTAQFAIAPAGADGRAPGGPGTSSLNGVLLSDRDIRAQVDAGRVSLDPFDAGMIQPSSIDVRLDRYFRLFDNHKYPVIDPAQDQPELTRLVEVDPAEGFVLHCRT